MPEMFGLFTKILALFFYLHFSTQEEQDEEDFMDLDEPLPECTLAFTYGIGKQVAEDYKYDRIIFSQCLFCSEFL